jgi:superfamily II DNA helicase RecQ
MKLGELICVFENAMHLLMTATATPSAIGNLSQQMNLKTPLITAENVDRLNIFFGNWKQSS